MKDLDLDHELQATLDLFLTGDPRRVADVLHRDFVVSGLEDGLYVHANADVFLRFLGKADPRTAVRSQIAWVDARPRLASACLTQTSAQARRTTVVTLLWTASGWRIVSATFSVEEPAGAKVAPRGLLQ